MPFLLGWYWVIPKFRAKSAGVAIAGRAFQSKAKSKRNAHFETRTSLARLLKQQERSAPASIALAQNALDPSPEMPNAIEAVSRLGKPLAALHPARAKTAHLRHVATAQAVRMRRAAARSGRIVFSITDSRLSLRAVPATREWLLV